MTYRYNYDNGECCYDAFVNAKRPIIEIQWWSEDIDRRHYERSQQIKSRQSRNTIVTNVTIAIIRMILVNERY